MNSVERELKSEPFCVVVDIPAASESSWRFGKKKWKEDAKWEKLFKRERNGAREELGATGAAEATRDRRPRCSIQSESFESKEARNGGRRFRWR